MQHRVTRTARARRRSGGQKRPSGAFLERGRVPDGAPRKAATNVAAFLLHHSLRDGFMLRLRLAFSSRGLVAKNAPQEHFLNAPTDGAPEKAATDVAAFLLHHSLRDGLALRASARVRLAGTGR